MWSHMCYVNYIDKSEMVTFHYADLDSSRTYTVV